MAQSTVFEWVGRVPVEAAFWVVALVGAASIDPQSAGLNLCLLEHLGLPCPGDGLGRAIALLARGQVVDSWAMHPLAGPAVAMIVVHVGRLCWPAAPGVSSSSSSHSSPTSAASHV